MPVAYAELDGIPPRMPEFEGGGEREDGNKDDEKEECGSGGYGERWWSVGIVTKGWTITLRFISIKRYSFCSWAKSCPRCSLEFDAMVTGVGHQSVTPV